MKAAGVLLLIGSFGAAALAAPCIDVAKGYELVDAAKRAGEARFQKALADRKLKAVALTKVELGGRDVGDTVAEDFQADRLESAEVAGVKVRVVTAIEGSCGFGSVVDFVRQGPRIFRAERQPRRGTSKKVETCGCAYPRGGCGQRMISRAIGYVLPPDTTWGGVLPVEYVEDEVELTHATPCPPPQPLP